MLHVTTVLPSRGFIFQLDRIPPDLPGRLEAAGVAAIASRTVEGLYLEPAASLVAVFEALERCGVETLAMRAATTSRTWERRAETVTSARLRNPRSACWLPTAAIGDARTTR